MKVGRTIHYYANNEIFQQTKYLDVSKDQLNAETDKVKALSVKKINANKLL